MSDSHRAKLDDPALRGRLRSGPARYSHRPVHSPRKHKISDFRPRAQVADQEAELVKPQQLVPPKPDDKGVPQVQRKILAYPQKTRQTSTARPAAPRQKRSAVLTREAVSKKKTKRVKQKTRLRNPVFVVGLVIGLLLSGAYIGYMTLSPSGTNKVAVLSSQASEELVNGLPSEESVNAGNLEEYQVSPDLPRVLTISKIGVEARVKRLSIKDNNQLGSPANIFDTGWYEGSAKPGEGGVVLVSGHVAGPTKDGVFHRLGSISPDDTIKLERGDGKSFTYKVVTTKLYDHDKLDMVEILRSADPTKPGLNLITSSIRYDVRANKFEQRLVIFAVQQ